MSDVNNISPLSAGNGKKGSIPEAMLLDYLEGRLPAAKQREVEQWLANEGMESDAIDGLNTISPEETREIVNKLNFKLTNVVNTRKKKRRKPLTNQYTLIAIAIILMLAVLAFAVIKLMK